MGITICFGTFFGTFFQVLIIYNAQSEKECGENEIKSHCAGCELKCGQSEHVAFKELQTMQLN